jgi:hypothetical protein
MAPEEPCDAIVPYEIGWQGRIGVPARYLVCDLMDVGCIEKRGQGKIRMRVVAADGLGNVKPKCAKTVLEWPIVKPEHIAKHHMVGVLIEHDHIDVPRGGSDGQAGLNRALELLHKSAPGNQLPRTVRIQRDVGRQPDHKDGVRVRQIDGGHTEGRGSTRQAKNQESADQ